VGAEAGAAKYDRFFQAADISYMKSHRQSCRHSARHRKSLGKYLTIQISNKELEKLVHSSQDEFCH